jgi:hypothetical protein
MGFIYFLRYEQNFILSSKKANNNQLLNIIKKDMLE